MSSLLSRDKLPKIDLYALCLLSNEEKGMIDSIFPPESFTGEFISFSSFKKTEEPLFLLENEKFPLYPKTISFKNQPIGIFLDKDPSLLRALDKRTRIFYSQESYKESTQRGAEYFSNLREKELEERLKDPSFIKTEYIPYYSYAPLQRKKDKLSIIFEKKSERNFVIWIPTPIYSFWKEILKSFLQSYYPEFKIELKSTNYQLRIINASFLALILIQLVERGLFYKKNIHLEVNIKNINKQTIKSSIKSYKEEGFNKFIFHEISIKIPYSIRWKKEVIIELIKSFLLSNFNLPKITLSVSFIQNHPLFISSIEEIIYPLNDLLEQHILKHFDNIQLSYYDYFFKGREKDFLRFKEKNDYTRRRFSYEKQDIFPYYRLISSSKKGIGISISYFSQLMKLAQNREWFFKIKDNNYFLKYPYHPIYTSTLKIIQSKTALEKPNKKTYLLNNFQFDSKDIESPLFREAIDLSISQENQDDKNMSLEEDFRYLAGCCIEVKTEPWISQVQIINFDIILGKGRKKFLKEEKDRIIAIAQDFFERQIPENIVLLKDWENSVNLTILEEGEGSFIYFPYCLRNAFYSALLQTGIISFPSLYLK